MKNSLYWRINFKGLHKVVFLLLSFRQDFIFGSAAKHRYAKSKLLFSFSALLILWLLAGLALQGFAQAPTISYPGPQIYKTGTAVSLAPTTSGVVSAADPEYKYNTIIGSGFIKPSGIAVDAIGNVYVSDEGNNLVKKYPVGSKIPIVIGSGFNKPKGIAVDAAGNVYVADYGNNAVKKILATGGATITLDSQLTNPGTVAVDIQGNVFVGDLIGVKEIPLGGNIDVLLYAAPNPVSLAVNAHSDLYFIVTGEIETYTHYYMVVLRFGSDDVSPELTGFKSDIWNGIAINNAGGVYVAINSSIESSFRYLRLPNGGYFEIGAPGGISIDGAGNLYVIDLFDNTVKEYTPKGNYFITPSLPAGLNFDTTTGIISGTPTITSPPTNYTVTAYNGADSANTTVNIAINDNSIAPPQISYQTPQNYSINIPIPLLAPTNTGGNVPAATYGQVTTFAGKLGTFGAVNGPGLQASFDQPFGVATDAAGNLYITDINNNLIRKITPGGLVSTFAGSGTLGFLNGNATTARFDSPLSIATDKAGNIYVAGEGFGAAPPSHVPSYVIRKITPAGVVSTFAGNGSAGSTDGKVMDASFNLPMGMVFDAVGNMYLSDGNLIRKITANGIVVTIAGSTTAGNVNGTGAAAKFSTPIGLAVDAAGNVYAADFANFLIRKITPSGVVTTFAGNGINNAIDGTGTSAGFFSPEGLAFDKAGNLYVAESGLLRGKMRKITPAGVVTTLAEGVFTMSTATAISNAGDMYVVDNSDYLIRKISLGGYTLNKTLPAGLVFNPALGTISGTPTVISPATDYTITATNAAGSSSAIVNIKVGSTNANLTNLTVSLGTLTPSFTPAGNNYSVPVANNITSIVITPTASSPAATITVNGIAIASGSPSNPLSLNVGANTIIIVVTAQDGVTTNTYTIQANRSLADQKITFNPIPAKSYGDIDFDPGATSDNPNIPVLYKSTNTLVATIVNGKIHIVGTGTATITASQAGDANHSPAEDVSQLLTVNKSTPAIVIAGAQTKNYGDADFALQATSTNNSIPLIYSSSNTNVATVTNGLVHIVGAGSTIITTSQPGNDNYNTVSASQNLLVTKAVLTITADNKSRLYGVVNPLLTATYNGFVNGDAVASLTTLPTLAVSAISGTLPGSYPITVNGAASNNYSFNYVIGVLTIIPLNNAGLTNLTISNGRLSPAFGTGIYNYTTSVDNSVGQLTLTPTLSDATAKVRINGSLTTNNTPSSAIQLNTGNNTVTITVTAQDGVTQTTYSVTVYRGGASSAIAATNILTPNGDGKNDTWIIPDIQLYPNNVVTVFDRAGRQVYFKQGYNNEWDGTVKGAPLTEGTYYYAVDLGEGLRKFKGFITILRSK